MQLAKLKENQKTLKLFAKGGGVFFARIAGINFFCRGDAATGLLYGDGVLLHTNTGFSCAGH